MSVAAAAHDHELLTSAERASLYRNTTVVIALVSYENRPYLVYTVASNSTNPGIRAAAPQLGLTRWDPEGMPDLAGERHAEQLTLETGRKLGFRVHGMVVSRQPCADCGPVVAERGVPIAWVADPTLPGRRFGAPPGGGTPPPAPPTTPAVASDNAVVPTNAGLVRGTTNANVRSYEGIPYAAPPVGNLRWHSPVPPVPWPGVLNATRPGSRVPNGGPGNTSRHVSTTLQCVVGDDKHVPGWGANGSSTALAPASSDDDEPNRLHGGPPVEAAGKAVSRRCAADRGPPSRSARPPCGRGRPFGLA